MRVPDDALDVYTIEVLSSIDTKADLQVSTLSSINEGIAAMQGTMTGILWVIPLVIVLTSVVNAGVRVWIARRK